MSTRRNLLKAGALAPLGLIAAGRAIAADPPLVTPSTLAPADLPVPFTASFRRPPELEPYETGFDEGDPSRPYAKYALTQQLGQASFLPGRSTTVAGYNGIFPGPTIRAVQGTRTEVRITNGLPNLGLLHPEAFRTVTHLHGSASLPQYDGYANDFTAPGYVKNYRYPNHQNARTLWYHDHNHHVTAQNVYSGLAGFYPMSDPYEQAQLPQGQFDVPLMVSDAMFNADGSLGYDDNGHKGLWGDVILVNGVPWPTMTVLPRVYRFRVLVASISRSYRFALSNRDPLYVVGTDGGMVANVQPVASWRQGSAERYEVLIDFRKYKPGQSVELRNLSNKNNLDYANTGKVMRFSVVADTGGGSRGTIPTTLDLGPHPTAARGGVPVMSLTPQMAVARRKLVVERNNSQWKINGETWADVERSGLLKILGNPKPMDIEQWDITNASGGWFHPVHIHLIDGRVIGRNTNGGKPFAWELGPKDVFYAGENETVSVLMQFDATASTGGRYMVHCHNLVHEDHDMMIQFAVGDVRQNDPVNSDPAIRETLLPGSFAPVYRPGYPAGT